MVERKDSRLLFHGHDFRYGNSTDFRCYEGLIRETVRPFSSEAAAYAGRHHSPVVSSDVEPVGGVGGRVE